MTTSSPVKSTTNAPVSASRQPFLTVFPSAPHEADSAGTGAASAVGTPRIVSAVMDPIEHRDDVRGYVTVPVLVQRWSDGYTILTFTVTTAHGDHTAYAWLNRDGELALQIKSSRNRDRYTLSSTRCECVGFTMHHHCRHLGAAYAALAIVETWQFAERQRARTARKEAMA
jgi:hypothetical protein